mgnify:FL=1
MKRKKVIISLYSIAQKLLEKEEEKRQSTIITAKPSELKDFGSPHDTATFATPVNLSKVASPRSFDIPEPDEIPRKPIQAQEKVKSSESGSNKLSQEKEKYEAAKRKLKLLREAETLVINWWLSFLSYLFPLRPELGCDQNSKEIS